MPEFIDVSCHFDDIPAYDGYAGTFLFNAQFNTFDESSIEGAITKKRTMSVRPGTVIPARRVLDFMGEKWILGDGTNDGFQGVQVRTSFWMKKVTDSATILSPTEACNGSAGIPCLVYKQLMKYTVDGMNSADYFPFWEIFTANSEVSARGSFLKMGDTFFRARCSDPDISGLIAIEADELESSSIVTATLGASIYDPITDSYTGAATTTPAIMLEIYRLYNHQAASEPLNHAGDVTLIVPNTVAVEVGNDITINAVVWKVLAKAPELDAWNLHLRKA